MEGNNGYHMKFSSNNNDPNDNMTEEQIQEILEIDEYKTVDNTVPNFVTDGTSAPDEILKTEILICEKCLHPNIIGTESFNRREKELHHIKTDSVTYASLSNFSKLNKLDMNAAIAMLMRIVSNPDVQKMVMGTFSRIPKRKGKKARGDLLLHNENKY